MDNLGDRAIGLLEKLIVEVNRANRELKMIRELVTTAVHYVRDAESEIPEKMRRFITYMHDLHDVTYMYEQRGHQSPPHVLREMERCDDRYRQLLNELHLDGGTFEKVRREMAADPENRWEHTRFLTKPKEKTNEARKSDSGREGGEISGSED